MKKFIKKIPSFIKFGLPIFIIFTIVLLAYWPGILVSDSMVQWNQTQTRQFTDWHPAYNTIYIFVLSLIWNTPGFVLLIQCLIMSLVSGYFLSRLEKYYKVNKYFLYIAGIIFAMFPINFNFAVTLLKDSIYSIFILLLVCLFINIINDTKYLKNWKFLFILFITCLAISLFRHNGIIVVLLSLISLIIINRKEKFLYIVLITWLATHLILNSNFMFKALNIQEGSYANKYGPISHIMARILNNENIQLTEEELNGLSEFVDIEQLKATYNCYNMDYSINSQNIEAIKENSDEYVKLAIQIFAKYPKEVIKHYIALDSFLYSPIPFKDSYTVGMFIETDLWVYSEQYPECNENSKISTLLPILKNSENKLQNSKIGTLLMRPAGYMYVAIIEIIILMVVKHNKKIGLLILPAIFNILSLAPAIPVAMTRYIYSMLISFYFINSWFIYEIYLKIRRKKRNENSSNNTML